MALWLYTIALHEILYLARLRNNTDQTSHRLRPQGLVRSGLNLSHDNMLSFHQVFPPLLLPLLFSPPMGVFLFPFGHTLVHTPYTLY